MTENTTNRPATQPAHHTTSRRSAPDTSLWTAERIRALGAVTDLPTAASILGLSRTLAYHLARYGQFPVPVLRAGTRYRVPVAPILAALHLPTTGDQRAGLDAGTGPGLDHHTQSHPPQPRRRRNQAEQEGKSRWPEEH